MRAGRSAILETVWESPMQAIEKFAPVIGRILLALIFVMSGFSKITGFEGTAGFMASKGMPLVTLFLIGAIVLEIGGGLSLIAGFKARWGALALIVFTIPATLIFHNFWALEGGEAFTQQIMFMKNLAMMGGLLMVMAFGAGPLSVDARSGGR